MPPQIRHSARPRYPGVPEQPHGLGRMEDGAMAITVDMEYARDLVFRFLDLAYKIRADMA